MIIRTEIEPSHRIVRLVGRFDAHETPSFRASVLSLVTAETNVLQIDLSQVAFVDSTALAELVRLQKTAKSFGGEVILVDLSDPVRVILEITDLAEMFTIIDAAEDSP
ncbi:anti-sigma B factor antagonist [Agreia bicolorata]|uniref:Anti-sigma factor antagonist n=1 Tax=Agreia bicolorata TaxID=110935 RepID=A0A1T4XYE2_9MICO|nr:STAS domain-containing protein [Agreia bicolorata]SKA94544.1 anti-sigma B factor antagonist [Agreia bicolorata]